MKEMKTRMNETGRQAYCRPETWTVPCELAPMMGPSVHADGFHWNEQDGNSLNWNNGGIPPGYTAGTFHFRSVWDTSVKELQNGQLVVIDVE